jgi:hypothetical protein
VSDLTPAACSWLATHHGVITRATLRTCGVSPATTQRLVRAGGLISPAKGVYVLTSTPNTLERRCAVLCATHPSGFVTGPTAGMLLGLRRMPRVAPIHFSVRHGVHLVDEQGVHLRQTTVLRSSHRTARSDGIVTASWARLAFDLAADLADLDHLSVVEQLRHEHGVSMEELSAIGRLLCHPARRGSGRFARTVARLQPNAPNESHPEVALAEALRARGVPVEHQRRLLRADGRTARVDLAVPTVRWGVEVDLHPEHRTLDGRARDARRERDLHLLDWQIEPVTEQDMTDVDALAAELAGLYRARVLALAPGSLAS